MRGGAETAEEASRCRRCMNMRLDIMLAGSRLRRGMAWRAVRGRGV
jgi:predicted adenine nucleotide alpha hydrolase (AANH) superfamily ATPase